MGMFDKDKQMGRRIDEEFTVRNPETGVAGEPFILHGVSIVKGDEVETDLGKQQVVRFDVERIVNGKATERFEANSIAAALREKATQAVPDDFPALVELRLVWSKTWQKNVLAMQYLGEVPGDVLATSLPI